MNELHAGINPENKRRKFLRQLLTGSMATLAFPSLANALSDTSPSLTTFSNLMPYDLSDERYWELVKKQFAVPYNLIMVNAANLCPSPIFINDLVSNTLKELGKD